MCGRYYVDETVLQKITDQGLHVEGQDIHPGDRAPVLISSMDGAHFVILTTQANDSMKMTHDRMPLILEKDEVESWLRDADQTRKFLEKHPGELRKQAEYEQLSFIEF